ncbi:7910_t:CDS:2 [Entrophospora sp. SA101]|nr:1613_t:CDS:2 [Entrophospora sp. SA101]CAJ0766416.1 7910_t:CDS:2 [Entrophospora sp. SA101]
MGNLLKLYRGGDRALKLNALQRGIPKVESSYAFSTVKSHDKVSVVTASEEGRAQILNQPCLQEGDNPVCAGMRSFTIPSTIRFQRVELFVREIVERETFEVSGTGTKSAYASRQLAHWRA